jgi:hypothetical protein
LVCGPTPLRRWVWSICWPSSTASSLPLRAGSVSRPGPSGVRRTEVLGTCRSSSRPSSRTHLVSPGRDRTPTLGFSKFAPPSCSFPEGVSRGPASASARCCQAPCVFRPRGFSPPRRLPPPGRSQACCILLPTMGFIGFRPAPWRVHPVSRLPSLGLVPPRRCQPSRAFPACAAEVTSPSLRAPSSFSGMPAAATSRP